MGNKTAKLSPKTIEQLQSQSCVDFTSDEIMDWYKQYRKSLSSGNDQLTKGDFINVYKKLFSGDPEDFAKHVFRTFDTNSDGYVDFGEFIVGLCMSSSSDMKKKLNWAFSIYDIDGDGYISKEEMTHIINAICLMTDSSVPPEYKDVQDLIDQMFANMDNNKDGQISRDEFVQNAAYNSFIVNILECDPDPDPE